MRGRSWIVPALLLLLPRAAEATTFNWLGFRGGSFLVFQNAGGSTESGEILYTPRLEFYDSAPLDLSLKFGGSLLRSTSSSLFPILNYELQLGWWILPVFGLELGAGGQTWIFDTTSTSAVVSAGPAFRFNHPLWGFFDRVYADYSLNFLGGAGGQFLLSHEIRIGVGISFESMAVKVVAGD